MSRPLKFIECLDLQKYDIHHACDESYKALIVKTGAQFVRLKQIDPVQFLKTIEKGQPLVHPKTFADQIQEDLEVLTKIQPDLVIGDFRLSLAVSCRIKKIKYINITNAYWSPEIAAPPPIPEMPLVRKIGLRLFRIFVSPIYPAIYKAVLFYWVSLVRTSLLRVNLKFTDFRQLLVEGDVTLFCDTPELVPLKKLSKHQLFVGPLTWSNNSSLPLWWNELDNNRPRVLVSLGSSGDIKILPNILNAISGKNIDILVALSGRTIDMPKMPNLYVANYLPLDKILPTVSAVICNGGSPMSHSALLKGKPVLGVIFNNDQLLNMIHIEAKGAGLYLRYWDLKPKKVAAAIDQLLLNDDYRKSAESLRVELATYHLQTTLNKIVDELC